MSEPNGMEGEILRGRDLSDWEIVDRAGEKIGTVADVLFDRVGRIRMLDAEFGFPRKHVLLPQHRLEWGERRFIVPDLTRTQVQALPPYLPDRPLDPALLDEAARAFPRFYGAAAADAEEAANGNAAEVVPMADARGFKLASDAPDPRGWNVFGADGERVGVVAGLLVDPTALKIRYLDVDVQDDLFRLTDDRHVLVPLEHVDLKERGEDVWVRRLTAVEVARLPAYLGGRAESWLQRALAEAFA